MNNFVDSIVSKYSDIEWHDSSFSKLEEVARRWNGLPEEAQKQFHSRLQYLSDYGCADGRRRFTVVLMSDWAEMSFLILWFKNNIHGTRSSKYFMNGRLIWHGGPGDPLCVSITPQYWGIHT